MKPALAISLLCATAAAAFTAPASAQDYTGSYAGIGVGVRDYDADWSTTEIQNIPAPTSVFWEPATADHVFASTGARINFMVGHDWAGPGFIWGVEGQLGYGDSSDDVEDMPGQNFSSPAPNDDLLEVTSDLDVSLTARIGVESSGWLFFALGGVAAEQIETSLNCPGAVGDSWCIADRNESYEDNLVGWVAGLGFERAFGTWRFRGDVRYSDLGSAEVSFFESAPVDQIGGEVEVINTSVSFSLLKPF